MRQNSTAKTTIAVASLSAFLTGAGIADDFHDPESVGWKFVFGHSNDEYAEDWKVYNDEGYVPIDIETDVIDGEVRYAGVWQKNEDGRGWVSRRNRTDEEFVEIWSEYSEKDYRPIDQDTSLVKGKLTYSLIMVQNKEAIKWASFRRLTSAEFSANFEEYRRNFMPIDFDAVEYEGRMLYSIIWVENVKGLNWELRRDMSPEFYGDKFEANKDWARVAELDCYYRDGQLNYGAIWEENEPGRGWAARRELSPQGLRNVWKKYHDEGMRMIEIEACATPDGGVLYAAVFRENSPRYDWGGRLEGEDLLKNWAKANNAPGVAAAIVCGGKVVFRAGAGFADEENNIKAHGGSIYRTASIAKAVTAVLGYDLQDDGLIDLNDLTASIVPGMESAHDHTVLQLLQNAGCFGNYGDVPGNENSDQTQYESVLDMLATKGDGVFLTNDAILPGCVPGNDYTYTTLGYGPAGGAYEVMTGLSFDALLVSQISNPLGLSTLRCETRTGPDSDGDLVKLYDKAAGSGYEPVTADEFQNSSWKWPGGGMESSPVDLARLGDAVLGSVLFPEAQRDEMWSGSGANGNYGAGWDLSSSSSPSQVSKRGRQQAALAHIRIDVDDEITVVAMTNGTYTKEEGDAINELTTDLLDLGQEHCDPDAAKPDRDADGLPDKWELEHVRRLEELAGDQDSDHDGRTDGDEHLAGTDPRDAQSNLRLWFETERSGGKVRWTCEPTHEYTVYTNASLEEGSWRKVLHATDLRGNRDRVMEIDLPPTKGQSKMFWRVEAKRMAEAVGVPRR